MAGQRRTKMSCGSSGSALGASIDDPAGFVQSRKILAADAELASLLRLWLAGGNPFQLDARVVIDLALVHGAEEAVELRAFPQQDAAPVAVLAFAGLAGLRWNEGGVRMLDLPVIHEFCEGPRRGHDVLLVEKLDCTSRRVLAGCGIYLIKVIEDIKCVRCTASPWFSGHDIANDVHNMEPW